MKNEKKKSNPKSHPSLKAKTALRLGEGALFEKHLKK